MRIEKQELTVNDKLPSYKSIDFEVKKFGIKHDYILIFVAILLLPFLYIGAQFIFSYIFNFNLMINPKVFFLCLLVVPTYVFLVIFDKNKNDLKLLFYYFYWIVKRKNYRFFNNTNTFLCAKPLSKVDEIDYVKKS